jgi:hypothetical protein
VSMFLRLLWAVSFALGPMLGCTKPHRDQVPTSSLVVLRPEAGEVWTEGESYTIRWRSAGIARVNVGLALGGKDKGHAASDLPGATDSLRWQVPFGFVSGFGLRRSNDVLVRVENAADPTQFADSPRFTVVAAQENRSSNR